MCAGKRNDDAVNAIQRREQRNHFPLTHIRGRRSRSRSRSRACSVDVNPPETLFPSVAVTTFHRFYIGNEIMVSVTIEQCSVVCLKKMKQRSDRRSAAARRRGGAAARRRHRHSQLRKTRLWQAFAMKFLLPSLLRCATRTRFCVALSSAGEITKLDRTPLPLSLQFTRTATFSFKQPKYIIRSNKISLVNRKQIHVFGEYSMYISHRALYQSGPDSFTRILCIQCWKTSSLRLRNHQRVCSLTRHESPRSRVYQQTRCYRHRQRSGRAAL